MVSRDAPAERFLRRQPMFIDFSLDISLTT